MPMGHFTRVANYKRQTGRKSLTTKQQRRERKKLNHNLRKAFPNGNTNSKGAPIWFIPPRNSGIQRNGQIVTK